MKFCVALAYNGPLELADLARAAEAAGFEAVMLSDHLVYPAVLRTPYPYTPDGEPPWSPSTPWPDPFVAIASLAAVTERVRFITSVFILPLRHPVLAAKTIATTAVMSGNRLTLGIGAGWMAEEFDLVGEAFTRRAQRLEESLDIMRSLWTGEPAAHDGTFYRFPAVRMLPVPDEPIPVWGGGGSDTALRRAATLCDGWLSPMQRSSEIPGVLATLRQHRARSSRHTTPFSICAALADAFTLDAYRRLEDLGVTHLITVPWLFYGKGESLQQKCDGIRRFGDDVICRMEPGSGS
jgi:probable F420-dependent oxidoreductase